MRRCESVTIQFCVRKTPRASLALVLNCCIHIRVWMGLRTFMISLMYCDAVTVSLCNETLWKCHYAVLCLQSPPSVLALVLNCYIHICAWRVLTLQECHQCWGHFWSLCIVTLWTCFLVMRCCESVTCSFVFAKRPERPCISLELLYSHWCMKGSDTARVSPVLRTLLWYQCFATLWQCLFVVRRCESFTTGMQYERFGRWKSVTILGDIYGHSCIATLWQCLCVIRLCEGATIQFRVCNLALVSRCGVFTLVYEGFWRCKTISLDICHLCISAMLWKCLYRMRRCAVVKVSVFSVLCSQSVPSVLALVWIVVWRCSWRCKICKGVTSFEDLFWFEAICSCFYFKRHALWWLMIACDCSKILYVNHLSSFARRSILWQFSCSLRLNLKDVRGICTCFVIPAWLVAKQPLFLVWLLTLL